MTNSEITKAAKDVFETYTFNEVKIILNAAYKSLNAATPATRTKLTTNLQIAKVAMAMKHRAAGH